MGICLRADAATRSLRLACVALLALAATAGPAGAQFVPLPRPFADSVRLAGFEVSGERWLATAAGTTDAPPKVRLSSDAGRSWEDLALPAGVTGVGGGASAGPDGSLWLPAITSGGPELLRLRPDGAALEIVPIALADGTAARVSEPEWDAAGRPWVASTDVAARTLTLARLNADGAVAEAVTIPSEANVVAVTVTVGGSVWLQQGAELWRLEGGVLAAKGDVGRPLWAEGRTVLTMHGLSLDGGSTFFENRPSATTAGNAAVLLTATGQVLRRLTPATNVFSKVADAPAGATRLRATSRGLLAFSSDASAFALHPEVEPGWQQARGALSAATLVQLGRVNELRGDAGLPPMTGDEMTQRAAESHSRYWTLNPYGEGVDSHAETPGAPGFTGAGPGDRCAAAGAPACGEVMFRGRQGRAAVNGWAVTPYHGSLVFGPRNHLLGAGEVTGGPTVTNYSGAARVAGPVVYPRGRYDASRGFYGETPDPAVACAKAGFQVSYPLGTAVTFIAPQDVPVRAINLYRAGSDVAVAACRLLHPTSAQLVPDDPLAPNTRYRAEAVWEPTAGQPQTYVWEFETTGGDDSTYGQDGSGSQAGADDGGDADARLPRARLSFTARLRAGRVVLRGSVAPRTPGARVRVTLRRGTRRAATSRRLSRRSALRLSLRPPRGRGRVSVTVTVPAVPGRHRGGVRRLRAR